MSTVRIPYFLELPLHQWLPLPQTRFRAASDGLESDVQTRVQLHADDEYLTVAFACPDDPFHAQNTYTEHNSELWRQEVFELFIAPGEAVPTRYLELELNPNNTLFVGRIHNPTLEGDALELTLIPYEEAGIGHTVQTGPDYWSGLLKIPRRLIGPPDSRTYRLNFYRIVLQQEQGTSDWEGTPDSCSYLCWSPTLSGPTPRFHRPARFGTLVITP
jgi:hypothetical protein